MHGPFNFARPWSCCRWWRFGHDFAAAKLLTRDEARRIAVHCQAARGCCSVRKRTGRASMAIELLGMRR